MNFDDRRYNQGRGTEHFDAPLHGEGASKHDETESSKVTEFIDQYITCSLSTKNEYSELNDLVKTLQSHYHIHVNLKLDMMEVKKELLVTTRVTYVTYLFIEFTLYKY